MKRILPTLLLTFVFSLTVNAQTPCSGGMAGIYPCDGLTLQDYISSSDMNAAEAQDSWGWTDPMDGKEYAIVALDNGTAFVDISNPTNIRYLGRMNSHSGGSNLWRDVKTYNNHAFVVSEVTSDGMQVFDLTRLRGLSTSPTGGSSRIFSEDAFLFIGDGGSNDGRAHNIVINEDSGFAYIVGVNRSSNSNDGPIFVDISNPTSPSIVGEYGPSDYFHDAQVVTYDGPDSDYTGREIMIGCNENNMVIVDVTNKSNPTNISTIAYSNVNYTHQGWFTDDKRFFLVGDELDEDNTGIPTRTIVFDLNDLDNPSIHYTYSGPTSAIDHNGYVRGNRFYLANYAAGVRIIRIDGLYNPTPSMTEINYFDTYPTNNNAAFNGVWNIYPYFESGNLVVSGFGNANTNGDGGLFILKDPLYDNTDPNAICQNITVTLDRLTGSTTITATDLDNGSTDDFGIVSRTITNGQTTFTCDDVGDTFNVTLTVEDDYGNTSSCVAQVTVEAETTAYNGSTWSNGTPSIGSNAKISANYTTSSNGGSIDACTCEVDSGRTLTISGGDYLNITQDITVNGTLVVDHQGSVVQTDDSAVTNNNGTINVNLTTPNLASRDFMVLGSPMTGETRESVWSSAFLVLDAITGNFVPHPDVAAMFPGAENFADNNNDFWNEVVTGAIAPGEGYIVRPQAGYGQPGGIFNYTYDGGTLNTGDVDFTVIQNTPGPTAADNKNASPNVLANPYPSAIWANDFINANAMVDEVYFWEHLTPPSPSLPGAGSMNFSMEDISMYNLSGGTAAASDPGTSTEPNGYISTGQGFGIKASAAGTATFTNSMRRTGNNNTLRFGGQDPERIWLGISTAEHGMQKQALLAFNSVATEGMDAGYDSRRLATVLSVYTHLQDGSEQLGIQTLGAFDSSMTVPVGFSTLIDADTEYKIFIGKMEGTELEESEIYLLDNLTGEVHDLKTDSFTFNSGMGTFHNRFVLYFSAEVLGSENNVEQDVILYPNPVSDVMSIFSMNSFIDSVEIYDTRGRRMQEKIDEQKHFCSINISHLERSIYFVRVVTESGSVTKKIIKN